MEGGTKNIFDEQLKKLETEVFEPVKKFEEEIKKLKEILDKTKEALSQAESLKEGMKQKIAEVKNRMETEVYPKLKEYETQVEELKKSASQIDEMYKNHLSSVRKEIIEPYREVIRKAEEIKKQFEGYDNVINVIKGISIVSQEKLERLAKEKPQVYAILSAYARRSTPGEEGKWVAAMLDEEEKTLKEAILIGKEIGYTNNDLMPILAACGLKSYKYGVGVDEKFCKEFGVEKRVLGEYIVHIAANYTDFNAFRKIESEMQKQ